MVEPHFLESAGSTRKEQRVPCRSPGLAPGFALLLAFAWVSASIADGPLESDPDVAHNEADTNSDGGIDHAEFHHRMVEVFYFADANRDGFEACDTNDDAELSAEEVRVAYAK